MSESAMRCCICLEDLRLLDIPTVATACGHVFCRLCVDKHCDTCRLERRALCCPFCRAPLDLDKLATILFPIPQVSPSSHSEINLTPTQLHRIQELTNFTANLTGSQPYPPTDIICGFVGMAKEVIHDLVDKSDSSEILELIHMLLDVVRCLERDLAEIRSAEAYLQTAEARELEVEKVKLDTKVLSAQVENHRCLIEVKGNQLKLFTQKALAFDEQLKKIEKQSYNF